jgi:hypothetical protein
MPMTVGIRLHNDFMIAQPSRPNPPDSLFFLSQCERAGRPGNVPGNRRFGTLRCSSAKHEPRRSFPNPLGYSMKGRIGITMLSQE